MGLKDIAAATLARLGDGAGTADETRTEHAEQPSNRKIAKAAESIAKNMTVQTVSKYKWVK